MVVPEEKNSAAAVIIAPEVAEATSKPVFPDFISADQIKNNVDFLYAS